MKKIRSILILTMITIAASIGFTPVGQVWADEFGTTTIGPFRVNWNGLIIAQRAQLSVGGTVNLNSIELYCDVDGGTVRAAIYSDNGGVPGSLLAQSGSESVTSAGWKSLPISTPLTSGWYWLAAQTSGQWTAPGEPVPYGIGQPNYFYYQEFDYDSFPVSLSGLFYSHTFAIKGVYSIGPDFSIQVTPSTRQPSSGSSVDFTVDLVASGGFSDNVTLSVVGLPSGATPGWSTNPVTPSGSSTLTISTLVTTPGGSYPLTITGTGGGETHSVPATLVVTGPEGASFTVRSGASQITVTVRWSTTTSGSSVTLRLVDPSETVFEEASMVVYDRLTIDVDDSGGKTYAGIKRVSCPATPGSISAGEWTVLISKTGVTAYTCDIEVS